MVSAVHPSEIGRVSSSVASKGLHMVSAVHPAFGIPNLIIEGLQRGCTWLVQFIRRSPSKVPSPLRASKGLHMVSAVHPLGKVPTLRNLDASKGLHMVSAVHLAHTTAKGCKAGE